MTIVGDGIVRSSTCPPRRTSSRPRPASGRPRRPRTGRTRYQGTGTLTLDGSQYRVKVNGKFTADVDPTATHPATGTARDWGNGETTLKGGVPWPFWSNQRILLTAGPMSVDIFGRGGPRWHREPKGEPGKRHVVRKVVITKKFVNGKRPRAES